ncbi:MAG TPA: hypothetical protein PLD03_07540 [Thiomonas arsenitoxydans]|nr:hypothetical protein [Thiomonas arsenitoxydans]
MRIPAKDQSTATNARRKEGLEGELNAYFLDEKRATAPVLMAYRSRSSKTENLCLDQITEVNRQGNTDHNHCRFEILAAFFRGKLAITHI